MAEVDHGLCTCANYVDPGSAVKIRRQPAFQVRAVRASSIILDPIQSLR
jgi:hypothetical protein